MKPTYFTKTMITGLRVSITIMLTIFVIRSFAQNDPRRSESPYFFVQSVKPGVEQLPLKSTIATVRIAGVIADVTVEQEYRNDGETALEAIYVFPASTNAAVYGMEMTIGERRITARIEEKAKAREQYTQAKAEGKRASLLEQHRPNVFQMNVANILPGDVVKVVLRYTELLVPEEGTYRFVYPAVVGPRYTGESNNLYASALPATAYSRKGVSPSYRFGMHVTVSGGVPVQQVSSPTHKVTTCFDSPVKATVRLDDIEVSGGDRDFVLEYKLAGKKVESGLLLYDHGDEKFFLLTVQPPARVAKDDIPSREYVFVVDVSGSMHGFPIETAKTLIRNLVVNLRPQDRFNVMLFESGAYWLADESVAATAENIDTALKFLDRQRGGGGTNLLAAMKKAMSFPRHTDGLSRSFLVVTDGYVDVEKEVFDIIRGKGHDVNVFAFGIGSSVNRYLIDGMARAGQSESFIVLNPTAAAAESERFRRYVNSPVLTNIKTTFNGFDAYDVEPISLPDVMAERPVILYGKYRGQPNGSITIEGVSGGKNYKEVTRVDANAANPDHVALRSLWARKKIQQLDDYNTLRGSADSRSEIVRLGLKYNLLTAHTSFIAIEEKPVNMSGELTRVNQPLPLAAGLEESAIGFDFDNDDEEEDYTFHRLIELPRDFSFNTKSRIEASIERNMVREINQYIADNGIRLERIEVTVGIDGEVVTAKVIGIDISPKHQKELISKIIKHEFVRFKVLRVWNFAIVF